jgi:hypothetical protein
MAGRPKVVPPARTKKFVPTNPPKAYDQFLLAVRRNPYDTVAEQAIRVGVSERTIERYRARMRKDAAQEKTQRR